MSARLIREDAPMEICNQTISDYCIVPSEKVLSYLKMGYQLCGQIVCQQKQHRYRFYQALVKIELPIPPALKQLSAIERRCLVLFLQGATYKAIAQQLDRSVVSIPDIMKRLRAKFQCEHNRQLWQVAQPWGEQLEVSLNQKP